MASRSGRAQPSLSDDAGSPTEQVRGQDDVVVDSDYAVHQRGTFPESGKKVAFRSVEGETVAGRFRARLSWDTDASPHDIVIHLSAFLVDENSKVPVGNPYYCVNHDNDRSKDGSTVRKGRRRHGHSVNDEMITVVLDDVDEDVYKIVFVAYIQDADSLKHTFRGLVDGQVALQQLSADELHDDEIIDLEPHILDADYYDKETAVVVGELFRRTRDGDQEWVYREIGEGRRGLRDVGADYGVVFV